MSDTDSDDDEAPQLIEVPQDSNRVIPVTILAGFLGSGKTTLLNHILTSNHGKRIAVIENEFGEGLGIESMIAKSGVDGDNISDFFELSNGCICCTVKDDLVTTLEQLIIHKDRFDYILIETTGLANPGPVVSALWTDDHLGNMLCLDGVVCVVDSINFEMYLNTEDVAADVKTQVCFADRILLNKADLVTSEQMATVKEVVQSINSYAQIATSTYSNVNLDFVLNTHSYTTTSDTTTSTTAFDFLQCIPCEPDLTVSDNKRRLFTMLESTASQGPHSISDMKTHYLRFNQRFQLKKLEALLDELLYGGSNGTETSANHSNGVLVNKHALLSPPPTNPSQVNSTKTMAIFRMKGIVHTTESDVLYVLQAVHNIFDLQPSVYKVGDEGDLTQGDSVLVIIGRNLDMEYLEAVFRNCSKL